MFFPSANLIPKAFLTLREDIEEELRCNSDSYESEEISKFYEDVIKEIQMPEFDENALGLHVKDALKGYKGYLTEEDLINFDLVVDKFVNSNYYDHPTKVEDVVSDIVALYVTRERVFDYKLCRDFVDLLELIEEEDACDEANYHFEVLRPWGRNDVETECFVITLNALFEDTPGMSAVYYRGLFPATTSL